MAIFSTARERWTMALDRIGREPWPGNSVRDKSRSVGKFFGGLDQSVAGLPIAARHLAAFGETDFGFDIAPVLFDQVADAHVRGGFLASFGDEDDIAIERDFQTLEQQHGHHAGGHVVLVVESAAAVDESSVAGGAERSEVDPLGGVDLHRIGVSHDQQGLLRSVALEPGDQVGARGLLGRSDHRNAFGFEDFLDVFDDLGFISRRIGGASASG